VGGQGNASLWRKRFTAGTEVGVALLGAGGLSAAPTPTLELPKQATIIGADAALCLGIARCYFDDFNKDQLQETFRRYAEAGGLGALAGYGAFKLLEALVAEATNFVPLAGWLVSGSITASVTGVIGVMFLIACDRSYRSETPISVELIALTGRLAGMLFEGEAVPLMP
jgi:hypothetical protein